MAKTKLTEGRVKALRPRSTVREIRDKELRGFGVRVYPTGRKCYFIHCQHEGSRVWNIVGGVDELSLADAREQAMMMMAATRSGTCSQPKNDTLFEHVAEEVFLRYGRNWKPRTLKVNKYYYRNQILPWFQGLQIGDITVVDVRKWFASLHETPVAADRSAPVLSVIMSCAETYGYRAENSNPCKGIKRYRRRGRERFLSEGEVCRLGAVLKKHDDESRTSATIIRLLLMTGCRKSELVTLRWRDYRNGHLHLCDSKSGPRMVWLSSPARRILDDLPRTSQWVFPSPRTNKSLTTAPVERFWQRVRSETGLQDVRLHDLRHTYASIAVMHGESVLIIGRLLGHSNPETTLKYAHLADGMVLEAARAMGDVLGGSAP